MKHESVETNAGLLVILTLAVISIGGLVEIVPLFYIDDTIEEVEGVRPYTPLEQRGRPHRCPSHWHWQPARRHRWNILQGKPRQGPWPHPGWPGWQRKAASTRHQSSIRPRYSGKDPAL